MDTHPMAVLACAPVFDFNPFLSLFGLFFQFCRKYHAQTKQCNDIKTFPASKGWKTFKINITDFSTPAFHSSFSFPPFLHKKVNRNCFWLHPRQDDYKSCPLRFVSCGKIALKYTFVLWHQNFSSLKHEVSFNSGLKLNFLYLILKHKALIIYL